MWLRACLLSIACLLGTGFWITTLALFLSKESRTTVRFCNCSECGTPGSADLLLSYGNTLDVTRVATNISADESSCALLSQS